MIHAVKTVRVGIRVERTESDWDPFLYRMFYCRQKDKGDATHCAVSEWAYDEVSMLNIRKGLPGCHKMKVGETRRYWVQMEMVHSSDYWGEHDSDISILSCRRAR